MTLNRKFWEERAAKLFKEWDAYKDPYSLPSTEIRLLHAKVEQACTITMLLAAVDAAVKEAKSGRIL